jgi:hypothetical protein
MTLRSESYDGDEGQDDDYESWTFSEQDFHWLIDTNGQ